MAADTGDNHEVFGFVEGAKCCPFAENERSGLFFTLAVAQWAFSLCSSPDLAPDREAAVLRHQRRSELEPEA
jgi:hypothetical protein